jgi:DNA-binding MarR family transcriptional regulator
MEANVHLIYRIAGRTIPFVFTVLLITGLIISCTDTSFVTDRTSISSQVSGLYGKVTDYYSGKAIFNATVGIYYEGGVSPVQSIKTNVSGQYVFLNISSGNYTVKVRATDYGLVSYSVYLLDGENREVNFRLVETAKPSADNGISTIPIAGILILIMGVVLGTLLYSKLVREKVLEHETRRMVYDHIREHPGIHYRAILDELSLKMGVLTHHLGTLEKENYIKSVPDGIYRRYYPAGTKIVPSLHLTDIQQRIVTVILENPGISQSGVAAQLGLNRMHVNYHVKKLAGKCIVKVNYDEKGKSSCYSVPQDT